MTTAQVSLPTAIPTAIPTNNDAMIEYMKMSMITSLIGSTINSSDMTVTSICMKLLLIVGINYAIKIGSVIINKLREYSVAKYDYYFKPSDEMKESMFKYSLLINDNKYKPALFSYVNDIETYLHTTTVELQNLQINEVCCATKIRKGASNYVHSVFTHPVKIKKIRRMEYIYFIQTPAHQYKLACNTSQKDLIDFINEVYEKYKNALNKTLLCYNGKEAEYSKCNSSVTFSDIFFEQKDELLKLINRFNDADWYKRKHIPRHLGLLLHGVPGTGKTSFIKACVEYIGKNINMADASNIKTKKDFDHIIDMSLHRIILFEDFDRIPCIMDLMGDKSEDTKSAESNDKYIDTLYLKYVKCNDDDEKKTLLKKYEDAKKNQENKLDLAYILNKLDGVIEIPGRLIIFTANFPERISKALLRPGRIDYVVEFKKATNVIVGQIIQHFYELDRMPDVSSIKDYALTHAEIYSVCKKHDDHTLAINELVEKVNNSSSGSSTTKKPRKKKS